MPAWMDVARKELSAGVREVAGQSDNERILAYWTTAKIDMVPGHDEISWCAAFVGACLERSGIAGSRKPNARSYMKWGRKTDEPYEGCIAVFERGNSSWQGHVAFFLKYSADKKRILVLGGNQGDKVSAAWYGVDKLIGFREPGREPEKVTAERLRSEGSRTIAGTDALEKVAAASVGTPVVLNAVNKMAEAITPYTDASDTASGVFEALTRTTAFIISNWWVAAIVGGFAVVMLARQIKNARIDDALTGAHTGRKAKENK